MFVQKPVIRLGDRTSHGGQVVEAMARFTVDGVPVARVGDKCSCPVPGHDNCTIVEGDPHFTIEGIPVAYEGCRTSCGSVCMASQTRFTVRGLGGRAFARSITAGSRVAETAGMTGTAGTARTAGTVRDAGSKQAMCAFSDRLVPFDLQGPVEGCSCEVLDGGYVAITTGCVRWFSEGD